MKVVIIGTGNVATVLGKKIITTGNQVMQIVGRDFEKSNILASRLQTTPVYNTRYISLQADLYIIAVSDSSVPSVAGRLKLNDKMVVHTAAAVSKDVLAECSENYGVLYPLQTLVKEANLIPPIPVLVDGNNETTKKALAAFSSDWAERVQFANDETRLKLHVAAVFVNNFTNYIFTVAEEYCKKEQLKFNLLYPLIEETITRLKSQSPAILQTGPAARKDFQTIEKHKQMLKNQPEIQKLYDFLTDKILEADNKKDH